MKTAEELINDMADDYISELSNVTHDAYAMELTRNAFIVGAVRALKRKNELIKAVVMEDFPEVKREW